MKLWRIIRIYCYSIQFHTGRKTLCEEKTVQIYGRECQTLWTGAVDVLCLCFVVLNISGFWAQETRFVVLYYPKHWEKLFKMKGAMAALQLCLCILAVKVSYYSALQCYMPFKLVNSSFLLEFGWLYIHILFSVPTLLSLSSYFLFKVTVTGAQGVL